MSTDQDAKGHHRRKQRKRAKNQQARGGGRLWPMDVERHVRALPVMLPGLEPAMRRPGTPSTEYDAAIDSLLGKVLVGVRGRERDKLTEIDQLEANDNAIARVDLAPGTRVVLRAARLVTMGYGKTGPAETLRGVWTIIACNCDLCALGNHVCVDEDNEHYGPRHFARAAVRPIAEIDPCDAGRWFLKRWIPPCGCDVDALGGHVCKLTPASDHAKR